MLFQPSPAFAEFDFRNSLKRDAISIFDIKQRALRLSNFAYLRLGESSHVMGLALVRYMASLRHFILHVFLGRPKPQVARVHAGAVVASMANVFSGRNLPIFRHPRDAMSALGLPIYRKIAVSVDVLSARPRPTCVWSAAAVGMTEKSGLYGRNIYGGVSQGRSPGAVSVRAERSVSSALRLDYSSAACG